MKRVKSTYLISANNRNLSFVFFLVLSFICVHNKGISQESFKEKIISLKVSKGSIKEILSELKDRTKCVFSYSSARVNLEEEVFVGRKKKTINEILEIIFEKQPIIPYFKEDKRVILAYDVNKNEYLANTTILNGFIKDKATGEPLIGASIYNRKREIGTLSNDFGYFQFQVNQEVDTVTFSYLGYKPRSFPIRKLKKELFSVFLNPEPLQIDDVVIERKVFERTSSDLSSNHYFNEAELKDRRGTLGENDPFQSIFSLPGIQSGHEAQNNIFVRGGGPDQNLIMMDGVPMYETSHLLGLTSVFNADAVKNIQVFKQAFPSAYGGRLSSVVNFHIAEGNLKEHKFGVGVSPLSTRISAEGPLSKGNTSYNLTLRKSLIDLIVDPIAEKYLDNTKTNISFYDVNAKIHHNLSDGSNLDINAYAGRDKISINKDEEFTGDNEIYTVENHDQINWSNRLFNVRWNRIVNDKLFTKIQFHFSNYGYDSQSTFRFNYDENNQIKNSALDVLALSRVEDASLKLEANYFINNNIKTVIGGGSIFHKYNPSIRQSQIELSGDINEYKNGIASIDASEWFGFGETQIDFSSKFHLNFGAHFSRYLVREKAYSSLQPRLSMAYTINDKQQISFSATKMTQYIHLLVNNGIGLPSELWIPTTDNLAPEHSYQVSASYKYELSNRFHFTIDGYYKKLENVIEYTSPFDLFNTYVNNNEESKFEANSDWEEYVSSGNGTSKGVELFIHKKDGRLNFAAGYSYSVTDRLFPDLNEGKPFPYKYDRTHDINLSANFKLTEKLRFDAGWVYGTGNAFSVAIEQYETIGGGTYLNPGVRNNLRMPDYHKLDLGLSFMTEINKSNKLKASVGVYNAYNRKNAFYVYLVENPIEDTFNLRQVSVFPILPNFDIHYSF